MLVSSTRTFTDRKGSFYSTGLVEEMKIISAPRCPILSLHFNTRVCKVVHCPAQVHVFLTQRLLSRVSLVVVTRYCVSVLLFESV